MAEPLPMDAIGSGGWKISTPRVERFEPSLRYRRHGEFTSTYGIVADPSGPDDPAWRTFTWTSYPPAGAPVVSHVQVLFVP